MLHELQVSDADKGLRLDVWLEQQLPGCSRSLVAKQIKAGRCELSSGKVKPAWKLRGNEKISIEVPEIESLDVVAEDLPIEIIHEDDDLLIVNKAAGMVVHPAIGHTRGTLLNGLMGYAKDAWQPLLVHRLDVDTTGLIIVAKNPQAHQFLQEGFKNREVKKIYLALCHGLPKADYFEHHGWIGHHPKDFRKRFVFKDENPKAKSARSDFWVRERHDHYSVLEVHIHTGRTHQIRVHLQDLGHSILADHVYGRSGQWPLTGEGDIVLTRQALHAWHLSFQHPNGEEMHFSCPIPADLSRLLQNDLSPLDAANG